MRLFRNYWEMQRLKTTYIIRIQKTFRKFREKKLKSAIKIQATYRMHRQILKDLIPGGYGYLLAKRRFFENAFIHPMNVPDGLFCYTPNIVKVVFNRPMNVPDGLFCYDVVTHKHKDD